MASLFLQRITLTVWSPTSRPSSVWARVCNFVTSTQNRLYIGWFGVIMVPTLLSATTVFIIAFITSPKHMETLFSGFNLLNVLALNWTDVRVLTFLGGLNPITASLWLTDVAHHHVAIGVVFLVAGHLYQTQFGIGSRLSDLLIAHRMLFINSWHAQLAINLAIVGSLSILFAHHEYAMPAYPYIAYDRATQLSLFTHHMWIGGFFIVGAAAHGACFMVYDYQLRYSWIVDRVLAHKHAILVHLNWVSIFLGLHSFGLYIHNDTMNALGRTSDMFADSAISIQPVFAQWVQHVHLGSESMDIGLMPIQLGTQELIESIVWAHGQLKDEK